MIWAMLKFLCVGIPVAIFFGLIGFLTWEVRTERWKTVYRKLASRYGGEVYSNRLRPRLRFQYHGMETCLRSRGFFGIPRATRTTLQALLPNCQLPKLVAFQPGQRMHLGRDCDMQLFQLGIDELDQQFQFFTSDPRMAAKLLNSTWLERFSDLRRRFPKHAVAIEVTPISMTIIRSGLIRKEKDLDDFIRLSLKLVDVTRFSTVEGLEFCSDLIYCATASVRCPICTEPPRNKIVVCASCKTLHCLDCWQYNGRCGMFACGETRTEESD